jgi:hypothetical protein
VNLIFNPQTVDVLYPKQRSGRPLKRRFTPQQRSYVLFKVDVLLNAVVPHSRKVDALLNTDVPYNREIGVLLNAVVPHIREVDVLLNTGVPPHHREVDVLLITVVPHSSVVMYYLKWTSF